jgi:hypothetical protein
VQPDNPNIGVVPLKNDRPDTSDPNTNNLDTNNPESIDPIPKPHPDTSHLSDHNQDASDAMNSLLDDVVQDMPVHTASEMDSESGEEDEDDEEFNPALERCRFKSQPAGNKGALMK